MLETGMVMLVVGILLVLQPLLRFWLIRTSEVDSNSIAR